MRNFEEFVHFLLEYKNTYGNMNVPSKYVTKNGFQLGAKVRYVRKGEAKLSVKEKLRLDEIGFSWKVREHYKTFEEIYSLLVLYKKQFGDLKIENKYVTVNGEKLGLYVSYIRSGKLKTSESERKKLDDIGFIWNVKTTYYFEYICELLKQYKDKYGNLLIPIRYVTHDEIPLGAIVNNIRQGYRNTTLEEKIILDELGFVWHIRKKKVSFDEVYKLLIEYKKVYRNVDVDDGYITQDGVELGRIVTSIRNGARKVTDIQKERLDGIGFEWKRKFKKHTFEELYKLLKEYKNEFGDLNVPNNYYTSDGINLGGKVWAIRANKRKLDEEQIEKLNKLGFQWHLIPKAISFDEIYEMLITYKKENGHLLVPRKYVTNDGKKLGVLVNCLRYGSRKTTAEQKERLDELGFVWNTKKKIDF